MVKLRIRLRPRVRIRVRVRLTHFDALARLPEHLAIGLDVGGLACAMESGWQSRDLAWARLGQGRSQESSAGLRGWLRLGRGLEVRVWGHWAWTSAQNSCFVSVLGVICYLLSTI